MKFSRLLLISTMLLGLSCSSRPKHGNGGGDGTSKDITREDGKDPSKDPEKDQTIDRPMNKPGSSLVWKRYRPLEGGLMDGLELTKKELCNEIGTKSCIDEVHLVALGGNEPFNSANHIQATAPTPITSIAIDRVVLAACSKRVEKDKAAGASAVVFKAFPLNGNLPAEAAINTLSTELVQRILARDPSAAELKALAESAKMFETPDMLALGLCVAIATSSENIFL